MGYPRLGHINFLNCLSLSYSLRQDHFDKGLQVSWGVPAVLNNDIMNHRLDVSQVSSITYARDSEELLLLPDVCIRSNGKVQSLILVAKKPIEDITDDKIILTAKSATTHCLTKIIMRKLYGAQPNYYVRHVDPLEEVPSDAAAMLLIGDDALYVYHHKKPSYYYYDIGEQWYKLTGRFMVFAVWVVDRHFAAEQPELLQLVYDRVVRGFQNGQAKMDQVIRSVLEDKPFTYDELAEYLQVIQWDFKESQYEDLLTFYRLAHEMNLIDHLPELAIANVCR